MTNGEMYKTAKERKIAYLAYIGKDSNRVVGEFTWLEMEAEEEEPMNCPFCGEECVCSGGYVECLNDNCCYSSGDRKRSNAVAIAAHNRVCKAVKAYRESEVK